MGRGPGIDVTATDDGALSRRRFLQGAGAVAAAAGISQATTRDAVARDRDARAGVRGKLPRRPNILVIMADEYRFPPVYESAALAAYRERHYTAEESLRTNGLELTNHYIMTAACAPSRASFFTGQYPSLHGVSQTDGAAKGAVEKDIFWADPDSVPTMGDYFRAGGYDTYYKGKWHVSLADLHVPGTYDQVLSFDAEGNPDPAKERMYLEANRLDEYGFDGWIGPEPHGANPLNSGSSATAGPARDEKFAAQTVNLLNELASRGQRDKPWLVVSSFVNPHDIVLWGEITRHQPKWDLDGQLVGTQVPDHLFDEQMYRATSEENLANKPTAQASYVETYPKMLQPSENTLEYRKFYYQLQENVNREIQKVLDALAEHKQMAEDTIVIFTSDHGDMLGAHGGMFQKWHQAYEESTHVPFIVHNRKLFSGREQLDVLTSHADVLPTLLGLAGLDEATLRKRLAKTHNETQPLVGRDLSRVILGDTDPDQVDDPVYFMTDDDPSRGEEQVTSSNEMYESVVQPNHLETVVANLPTGQGGAPEKWKFTRYYDTPQYWSDPGDPPPSRRILEALAPDGKDVTTLVHGNVEREGTRPADITVKRRAPIDQVEVYNVTRDRLELENLALSKDPAVRAAIKQLDGMLKQQCAAKRRMPTSGAVPGQRAC
jgi:choline-sulfatase